MRKSGNVSINRSGSSQHPEHKPVTLLKRKMGALKTMLIVASAFCCQSIHATLCTMEDLKEKFPLHIDEFTKAITKEELEDMCKEYIPAANGIVAYIKECRGTEVEKPKILKRLRFYEVIKETLGELCNPGSELYRKYLENIKCLRAENKIGTTCISTVMPNNVEDGGPCSYGFLYNGCIYKDVQEKCGWDALYVAKEIGRSDLELAQQKCCEKNEI